MHYFSSCIVTKHNPKRMKYQLVLILWQFDIIVWISVISAQNQVKAESSLGILEETN